MPPETKKPCTGETVQGENLESHQIQDHLTALEAKKQEVFALRDKLTNAEIAINKACVIMGGLYDNYLSGIYNADLFDCYQDRIMTQAEIVMDYLSLALDAAAQEVYA